MEQGSQAVRAAAPAMPVEGSADPAFAGVREAFEAMLAKGDEVGVSVCVYAAGRPVVDLWGGFRDRARTEPWQRDTICNAMSISKAMTAACLHLLIDRGQVDLDAPVARYWPEFAAGGKEGLLVRWVLDNRAGLPALQEDLWPGAMYDWAAMTGALARQAPFWPPGTQAAYHIRTFGFLAGEIVRRVSGKSLGTFYRDEIAKPFGIDYHIGLGDAEIARCAEFITGTPGVAITDPDSIAAKAARQWPKDLDYNADAFRRAEVPSSNGHGNARAVARFFAILAGRGMLDGKRLMSAEAVATAGTEQHRDRDAVLGRVNHQGLGFLLNSGQLPIGPNPKAFGQSGMGGAVGFCDQDADISFSYIQNKMHTVKNGGERAAPLVEALYRALGA
jgi:CubicO group peptidase (beta-lactamase class C family)